jgi:hypothetical protein
VDHTEDVVFLLRGGELTELARTPYELEDHFQEQLAAHPQLLGGGQFGGSTPRHWLLVSREIGVPEMEAGGGRWSLDHLFVDQEAIPTLVEVKRGSDNRVRREVVGQMLDYAANGSRYWPPGFLRSTWERSLPAGADLEEEIRAFAQTDAEAFCAEVDDNLRMGRVRMLFVSDQIPTELQTIIEYLNEQMDIAEVLGVSIARYESGEVSVLVPRVVGSSARLEQSKRGGINKTYQEDLESGSPATREVERLLVALAHDHGLDTRQTPKALQLISRSKSRAVLSFYPGWGTLDLALKPIRDSGHNDVANRVFAEASEIAGRPLTAQYPTIPVDAVLRSWDQVEEILLRLASLEDSGDSMSDHI